MTLSQIRQPKLTLVQVVLQNDHYVIDRNLDTHDRCNVLLVIRRKKEDLQISE